MSDDVKKVAEQQATEAYGLFLKFLKEILIYSYLIQKLKHS